jgi:lysophospholipase L1-like esterase
MRRWLLGITAILAGCGGSPPATAPLSTSTTQPNALPFLALGDSYTIGESVAENDRWPVQLAAALRNKGVNIADPTIIATTGWTTADLSNAMDHADLRPPYDLVGLLIGVNNQFQGRSEDEYRQQFADLLKRAIHLAGDRSTHVIVLSIPDWGVTPFARQFGADPATVGAAIDRFNAINRQFTLQDGAAYVDITPLTRTRRDLIADDGLHPSAQMYAKWVELALPVADKALRQ